MGDLREALRGPERKCILRALESAGWNKQEAARQLRISRSTLYKKIREHELERLMQPEPAAFPKPSSSSMVGEPAQATSGEIVFDISKASLAE